VNNELPYGYENTKYVARLQLDGGVTGYKWCINGTPSIPAGLKAGIASANTDLCAPLMPTSCSTLTSDTNWVIYISASIHDNFRQANSTRKL